MVLGGRGSGAGPAVGGGAGAVLVVSWLLYRGAGVARGAPRTCGSLRKDGGTGEGAPCPRGADPPERGLLGGRSGVGASPSGGEHRDLPGVGGCTAHRRRPLESRTAQ